MTSNSPVTYDGCPVQDRTREAHFCAFSLALALALAPHAPQDTCKDLIKSFEKKKKRVIANAGPLLDLGPD